MRNISPRRDEAEPRDGILWLVMAFSRLYLIDVFFRITHSFVWGFGSIDRKIRRLDREIQKLDEFARLSNITHRRFGDADDEGDSLHYAALRVKLVEVREDLIAARDGKPPASGNSPSA